MTSPRRFTELAAVAAAALFLASWGVLHTAWYDDAEIVDIPVYLGYGEAIADGEVPYRDIRPEYPPGALPVFVLPALVSDDEEGFRAAFEWLMAACGAAMVLLTGVALAGLRASRPRTVWVLLLVACFPLLLGSVVLTRFDLWPAALVAGGFAALVHGRNRLGFAVLGAAIAVKLYPAVLVPVAVAYVWRRRGRREAIVCLGVLAAVVALVFLPFLVVAPEGVAHSIGRQLSRPLQIESLGSALFLAAHHLVGLDVEMRSGHGSQNLHATGTGVAAVLFSLVQIGVAGLDLVTPARDGRGAHPLERRGARCVRRPRKGALAPVSDLARAGGAARRRPPRAPRVDAARGGARPDAALVPLALLGPRPRARSAPVHARAGARRRARRATRRPAHG